MTLNELNDRLQVIATDNKRNTDCIRAYTNAGDKYIPIVAIITPHGGYQPNMVLGDPNHPEAALSLYQMIKRCMEIQAMIRLKGISPLPVCLDWRYIDRIETTTINDKTALLII